MMKYTQLSLFDYTSQAISEHSEMEKKQLEIQDKLINDGVCVLSLFNGISCGRVALERAGIKVKRYVSFEIDKYANTVAQKNYPDDEYCGNVTTANFTQYRGFDLVIGGSPCTYWSIAKTNREITPDGVGGQLFMHFVRAVKETDCKYFLYENNYSIHKDIKAFISDQLGVEPIMINSALVSAQQRKRCYWTNIPNVEQPADRGILLKDVLISADREKSRCIITSSGRTTTRKYFKKKQGQMAVEPVSVAQRSRYKYSNNRYVKVEGGTQQYYEARRDKKSNCMTTVQKDYLIAEPVTAVVSTRGSTKACCIRATYHKIGKRNMLENIRTGRGYEGVLEPVCLQKQAYGRTRQQDGTYDRRFEAKVDGKSPTITSQEGRRFISEPVIYSRPHGFNRGGIKENKAPTVTSTGSWVHNNHIVEPCRVGHIGNGGQGNRIYSFFGKSVTQQANSGGLGSHTGLYAIPVDFDGDVPTKARSFADDKIYPVYKVENGLIEINEKTYPIKLKDGYYIIRKLTPVECERLQTLPDNYTEGVSNTQRYKCIGNGWTVEVIAHILRFLYIT